jgi:hypothetical protein
VIRWRTAIGALALALGVAAPAQAQDVRIDQTPTMSGNPYIGETLQASGGHVTPDSASKQWMWLRCDDDTPNATLNRRDLEELSGCDVQNTHGSSSYTLTSADADHYIRLMLFSDLRRGRHYDYDFVATAPSGRVTSPPAPAPPPPPPPPPTIEVPVPTATPVPTTGQVLHTSHRGRRVMKPFPVVRMRGRLTISGARITVLSVRAPKKARIKVTCRGDCPRSRRAKRRHNHKVTRVRPFQRSISAGTRITVTVTRRGFIGKRTVFLIRRGLVPLRADRCLNRRGKRTRCPASA